MYVMMYWWVMFTQNFLDYFPFVILLSEILRIVLSLDVDVVKVTDILLHSI